MRQKAKLLFFMCLILVLPVVCWADPFFTCDPADDVTSYNIELNGILHYYKVQMEGIEGIIF